MAWAMLQIGNCERKTGNLLGAGEAYKKLMNKAPEHPWAREAEWWATQVAWWAQWDTVRRQQAEKDLRLLR